MELFILANAERVEGGDELSWTTLVTMETTNETKRIYLAQTGKGALNKYSG